MLLFNRKVVVCSALLLPLLLARSSLIELSCPCSVWTCWAEWELLYSSLASWASGFFFQSSQLQKVDSDSDSKTHQSTVSLDWPQVKYVLAKLVPMLSEKDLHCSRPTLKRDGGGGRKKALLRQSRVFPLPRGAPAWHQQISWGACCRGQIPRAACHDGQKDKGSQSGS